MLLGRKNTYVQRLIATQINFNFLCTVQEGENNNKMMNLTYECEMLELLHDCVFVVEWLMMWIKVEILGIAICVIESSMARVQSAILFSVVM